MLEPVIEVIEEAYYIKSLNTKRKISALLPHDYYEAKRSYPVLYLQDGQSLFNPSAQFGDWAIDKSMAMLADQGFGDLIVIAIDHGEKERIKEYLPFKHVRFGQGKGAHYVEFMKEKLIPYVNRKYRTLQDHSHTGIGGSSMGGLISLFAGVTEPKIFSKMMIFSPSLWISQKIFNKVKNYKPGESSRLYLYAGEEESKSHLPNVQYLESILESKKKEYLNFEFLVSINESGRHETTYWREEFPTAIKWLFFNNKV